jgi:hypothetical protein
MSKLSDAIDRRVQMYGLQAPFVKVEHVRPTKGEQYSVPFDEWRRIIAGPRLSDMIDRDDGLPIRNLLSLIQQHSFGDV